MFSILNLILCDSALCTNNLLFILVISSYCSCTLLNWILSSVAFHMVFWTLPLQNKHFWHRKLLFLWDCLEGICALGERKKRQLAEPLSLILTLTFFIPTAQFSLEQDKPHELLTPNRLSIQSPANGYLESWAERSIFWK